MKPLHWLVSLLLTVPAIAAAVPILSSDPTYPVSGWTNAAGTFAIDRSAFLVTDGRGSYSTTSSTFTQSGEHLGYFDGDVIFSFGPPVDFQISAVVQEDGTVAGNLLGGVLRITAGAAGLPGVAGAGEDVVLGHAIDAAALDRGFGVAFLFALTYISPALAGLGDYLTFFGAYPEWTSFENGAITFDPWGRDWGPTAGFTNPDLFRTALVPEPSVLALLAFGAFFLLRRRR